MITYGTTEKGIELEKTKTRPYKKIALLLNRRSASSLEQLLIDITEAFQIPRWTDANFIWTWVNLRREFISIHSKMATAFYFKERLSAFSGSYSWASSSGSKYFVLRDKKSALKAEIQLIQTPVSVNANLRLYKCPWTDVAYSKRNT